MNEQNILQSKSPEQLIELFAQPGWAMEIGSNLPGTEQAIEATALDQQIEKSDEQRTSLIKQAEGLGKTVVESIASVPNKLTRTRIGRTAIAGVAAGAVAFSATGEVTGSSEDEPERVTPKNIKNAIIKTMSQKPARPNLNDPGNDWKLKQVSLEKNGRIGLIKAHGSGIDGSIVSYKDKAAKGTIVVKEIQTDSPGDVLKHVYTDEIRIDYRFKSDRLGDRVIEATGLNPKKFGKVNNIKAFKAKSGSWVESVTTFDKPKMSDYNGDVSVKKVSQNEIGNVTNIIRRK